MHLHTLSVQTIYLFYNTRIKGGGNNKVSYANRLFWYRYWSLGGRQKPQYFFLQHNLLLIHSGFNLGKKNSWSDYGDIHNKEVLKKTKVIPFSFSVSLFPSFFFRGSNNRWPSKPVKIPLTTFSKLTLGFHIDTYTHTRSCAGLLQDTGGRNIFSSSTQNTHTDGLLVHTCPLTDHIQIQKHTLSPPTLCLFLLSLSFFLSHSVPGRCCEFLLSVFGGVEHRILTAFLSVCNQQRTHTHTDAAAMSAGDVVCTGWLIKSPPEKKLKRFVSKSPVSERECDVFSIRSRYCSIMIHCQFMFSVFLWQDLLLCFSLLHGLILIAF